MKGGSKASIIYIIYVMNEQLKVVEGSEPHFLASTVPGQLRLGPW